MESLSLTLPDGRLLTGLTSFPSQPAPGAIPLIVTVHGGTYAADYYDADPAHSIRNISAALGVPVIAINRPGYKDSSPLPELTGDETYIQQQGKYIDAVVLPALWSKYGKGTQAVVLVGHSIGAAISTVTAGRHAESGSAAKYPLAGLVTYGIGSQKGRKPFGDAVESDAGEAPNKPSPDATLAPPEKPAAQVWPKEMKDGIMLHPKLCAPSVFSLHDKLNNPMSYDESSDTIGMYLNYWASYAARVTVPVMYTAPSNDFLWYATLEALEEYAAAFVSSPKVECGVQLKSPHCIELSLQGQAWMVRFFGFAMEGSVLGFCLSPDQQLLFSSAADRIINVWSTRDFSRVYSLYSTYDTGDVFCVSYSAALQTVYLGAQNTSIQWYDLKEKDRRPPPHHSAHPSLREDKFFDSQGPGGVRTPRPYSAEHGPRHARGGQTLEIDKENIRQYAHFGYVY
ncbi:hypothetical protein B0A49_07317, partial [Cryomyces minteri]